jgi:hypothetical protein
MLLVVVFILYNKAGWAGGKLSSAFIISESLRPVLGNPDALLFS